jgi:hypothetical protein
LNTQVIGLQIVQKGDDKELARHTTSTGLEIKFESAGEPGVDNQGNCQIAMAKGISKTTMVI